MENTKESHISLGAHMYNKVPHPFGDFIYLFFYGFDNKNKYIKNESDKILNKNIIDFNNPKSNVIIFIMGESSWKKRYSIYGYEKNTTPNMDVLFKQDLLGCVLNAYSQATITRDSIPLSFSFSTPRDYSSLTNEKSIIEIAKMQGYQTYWLSSQDISGVYSSKYGYLTKSVDHIQFTDWDDSKIPSLLDPVLKNDNKKFIILHLLGSHPPYTNFNKDEKINIDHLDDYDLTINHTDKIINEIFQKLRNNDVNFSLIYTSDHGEVVGKGHGLMKGVSQIEIPLLAYSNNNYNICDFYKQNKNNNGEINALTNKIVLLDMMGVELKNNYIKTESKNEDLLKPDGSIINYKNFK